MSGGKPIAVIGAAIEHIGKGGLSLMTVCLCVAFVARVGAGAMCPAVFASGGSTS